MSMNNSLNDEDIDIIQALVGDESDDLTSTSSSDDKSDDSDSESSFEDGLLKEKRKFNRISNFLDAVHRYGEFEFKHHFRLKRGTVDFLIGKISEAGLMANMAYGHENIGPEKAMLSTLWYLANDETFRQIGDRFNMTKSAAHSTIKKVTTYFALNVIEYIKLPVGNDAVVTELEFKKKAGIPGVLGAIDGTHIRIKKPIDDQEAYYNRKRYHSIILQVVSDDKKRFVDVFCGEAGSQHYSRVLRKSSLYERGQSGQLNIGENFFLGDSAYPCLPWLVTPFKEDNNLTQNQKSFNFKHSRTRVIVENSIGLLKARFRRLLNGFSNTDIKYVVICVVCACIFHNICINFDDLQLEYEENENCDDQEINDFIDANVPQTENRRNLVFERIFRQQ